MAEPGSVRDVFERSLPAKLRAKPDLVEKINAVFQFRIVGPGGGDWAVDCTVPGGAVTPGQVPAAGCTVTCAGPDFLAILGGKLNAPMAFMAGKLKLQGDMGLALKLQQILG